MSHVGTVTRPGGLSLLDLFKKRTTKHFHGSFHQQTHHFGVQDVSGAALNRRGDHATKSRGSSCELKFITLFYYPQNPVWHSGDGLPGLGPCGEGLNFFGPSWGLRLVIRGRGKVLCFWICLCFIFLAITTIGCVGAMWKDPMFTTVFCTNTLPSAPGTVRGRLGALD